VRVVVVRAGGQRFAIPTRVVVEVVPCVEPRPVPGAPSGMVGVIDYRGRVVPVLDLCLLLAGAACPVRMSSRIVVCDREVERAAGAPVPPAARFLGLLAEDVTRVVDLDASDPGAHPGLGRDRAPGMGAIAHVSLGDRGADLVQRVRVDELIPTEVLESLAGGGEAA
jgi:chemotaxis-related protein WspB